MMELNGEEVSADELVSRRDSIEQELKRQFAILEEQGGVGTKGPLIDHEGYPRADIDIYAVRTARNKIVCLQNDHKAVMRSVEQKLHQLHAQDRERRDSQHELPSNQKTNVVTSQGFVKVNEVTQGSPAAIAGLCVDDVVVEFGSIRKESFKSLQDIGTVVQHSQNRSVRVVVLRKGVMIVYSLKPQKWSGRGLLGCNIVPV